MPPPPTRLALQTGRLDDQRRPLGPADDLWEEACRWYRSRDDGGRAPDAAELRRLCERWPAEHGAAGSREAVAVVVALAAPFADRDRILRGLAASGVPADGPAEDPRPAPILVSPWVVPRPPLPHVYDPAAEERAPLIAVLDGPRSDVVAHLLEGLRINDETLADAIVLGADLDTLESLDRLARDARRAARRELAATVEHDRQRWRRRAEQARARQRLEGPHYGWAGDNFPPGCLEAARGEARHDVEARLGHRAPPAR